MAIRKPVLSVKEARSLAAHRSELLPSVMPPDAVRDPLVLPVRPHKEEVPAIPATVASLAEVGPLPAPEAEASVPTGLDPVGAQPHDVPDESPLLKPILADLTDPVTIVVEAPLPMPHVWEADMGLRRKAVAKKLRKADPDTGPPIDKRPKPQVIVKRSEEGKTQVFLSAALPARNVSKSFELLCHQYAPAKSLQMILRRAMDDYEVILENGDLENLPESYTEAATPEVCGIIQTSRIMPIRLVERARAHFDPLGFESERAFGRKLASAALGIFFEIQARH